MNKRGFTLIEIVMVLVLLGILAAVAVPKYFDLKHKAEEQTAKAVASEFQARINGKFAEVILQGESCTESKTKALQEAKKMIFFDVIDDKFTIDGVADIEESAPGRIDLKLLNEAGDELGPFVIAVPVCH